MRKETDLSHIEDDIMHTHDFDDLPHTLYSQWVQCLSDFTGKYISIIWSILMLTIVVNVSMRYIFHEGRIELEELQWHFYSVGWLLGLSYAFVHDRHVRVDILHERFSLRKKCWFELIGILFFVLPFSVIIIWYAIPYVQYSIELNEVSVAPGGLSHRWLIKSMIIIGFVFLFLTASAKVTRLIKFLFGKNSNKSAQKKSRMNNNNSEGVKNGN